MIELTNFQKETVVPIVVSVLNNFNGSDNTIDSHNIIYYLEDVHCIKVSPVSLRAIIHYIRIKELSKPVLANHYGYFTTTKQAEIINYTKGLRGRIDSIEDVYNSLTGRIVTSK